MQPDTTVGVVTNIEQLLLLDDDFDEERDWRKEVSMDEVHETVREQTLTMLSMHLCEMADSARLILLITV
jgi:hypothetical protein